ncbi:MAG: polymer-forming cytoskeletal protein [Planctomycetota bacterium]|nr:polymer-forming cytoskeletal protein [Planctomycetota bacterium]
MAILKIGDGYVFGEPAARPGDSSDAVDIYCQDIHGGVSLMCPHGALPAKAPMTSIGLPARAGDAAALLPDSPEELPRRNLGLRTKPAPERPGIGFVRAANGRTYKVHLVRAVHAASALERRAHIAYMEVPVVPNGGRFRLPTVGGMKAPEPEVREAIRRALQVGRTVPGDSFARYMRGNYAVVEDLLNETELNEKRNLVVEDPFTKLVRLKRGGSFFAGAGIAPEGTVDLDSYSAVGVHGDMAGNVEVNSYGYVYIDGDLTGTVHIKSYATVVIEGDLVGTLKVRSYTDLLLRGRIRGNLDAKGSCWSTFYLESPILQAELEALPSNFRSVTLHVRECDLPPGKHKKIGTWREVIVGDPIWQKIAR